MNLEKFIDSIISTKSLTKSCEICGGSKELFDLFQNMEAKYDIAQHTIDVLNHYQHNNPDINYLVALAIVFHDCGKIETAIEENNEIKFYQHQNKSRELFLDMIDNFNLDNMQTKYIEKLVQYHDDNIGKKLTRPILKEFGREFFKDFIELKKADILGHDILKQEVLNKELEEYSMKLNTNIDNIIKEENLYSLKQKTKHLSVDSKRKLLELFKSINNKEFTDLELDLFIKRYQEAFNGFMMDISNYKKTRNEDKGVTEKLWVDIDGQEALFKITQYRKDNTHTNAHYAELFVSQFCDLLGINTAKIDLAYNAENIGCVSYNFLKENDEMIDFQEIITNIRPDFDTKKLLAVNSNDTYSIPLILEGLESQASNKEEYEIMKKSFLEYCLVYSLIEHYDTNPSNISLIKNKDGIKLAPMFDNGTSLNISIPENIIDENLSDEWLSETRKKNLSKIGTTQGRCNYDELEHYIFSKHYDDVKDFIQKLNDNITMISLDNILSDINYNHLSKNQYRMITSLILNNTEKMLDRAELYEQKFLIENNLKNKTQKEINGFITNNELDNIYNFSQLQNITQEGVYHVYNALDFTTHCLCDVDKSVLSTEHKNLLRWAILFNNAGKINTHEKIEKNGKIIDTFRNYEEEGLKIANHTMDDLNFLPEDKKVISALIKSHVYRTLDTPSTAKSILNLFGERYLDLFFEMKKIEIENKSPEIKEKSLQQLDMLKDNIDKIINTNNREIISVLPIKTKSIISMGLKGQQIGQIQYKLAEYVRSNEAIYQYYKSRGHIEKYKNELTNYFKEIAKEIKQANKGGNTMDQKLINLIKENYKEALDIDFSISNDEINKISEFIKSNKSKDTIQQLLNKDDIIKYIQSFKEQMPKYNYRGIFIDKQQISDILDKFKSQLSEKGITIPDDWNFTDNLHITTSFSKPELKPTYEDIGQQVSFDIVGYSYNPEIGFALDIQLITANEHITSEFEATAAKRNPHITIGNPQGVKPMESAKLFEPNENTTWVKIDPIKVMGSYGGFTNEQTIDILNYEEKLFKEFADNVINTNIDANPYNKGLLAANNKDCGDKTLYLKSIIEQRLEGPNNAGSSFETGQTSESILNSFVTLPYKETTQEELERGGIRQCCRSFEIPLSGKQGVISAKDLPNDAVVYAVDGHGVGSLEFCTGGIEKKAVETTTLISLANQENECFLVLTALPGDVRNPSNLENKGYQEGSKFTKQEVIEIGGEDCVIKYVPDLRIKELEAQNVLLNSKPQDLLSMIKNICNSPDDYYDNLNSDDTKNTKPNYGEGNVGDDR